MGVCYKKIETRRKIVKGSRKAYRESSLRVHWDFTEGTGKIARNTPGDRRRRIVRLVVRNAGGCQIMGVRSLSLVVMYDCNP
ncbi:hypothetical protein BHE74_00057206 [Ensete ventricosum]|nr:hypothetical protein BHE74_00057206 [Ensete ventricosum]